MADPLDITLAPDWGEIENRNPIATSDAIRLVYSQLQALQLQLSAKLSAQSVPFLPANFSGEGSLTWTPDAADVVSFWAARITSLNVLLVSLTALATTTGGTTSPYLRVRIPFGLSAKIRTDVLCRINSTTFGLEIGVAVAGGGIISGDSRYIVLMRPGTGNWPLETNTITVRFQMAIPILG